MGILKEEKTALPCFINHASARMWFKAQYGSLFLLHSVSHVDGLKIYSYDLIKDKDTYIKNRDKLENKETINWFEYLGSYQSIEVTERGHIKILS